MNRSTTNYYLVNLSMADLLISIWCPFTGIMQKSFNDSDNYFLPAIFCKIDVFYKGSWKSDKIMLIQKRLLYSVLCMVSSMLTISAISLDRFMAVIWPLQARATNRKARQVMTVHSIVNILPWLGIS